jgi:hypothetical protein
VILLVRRVVRQTHDGWPGQLFSTLMRHARALSAPLSVASLPVTMVETALFRLLMAPAGGAQ